MSFFTNTTVEDLIGSNISRVEKLEEAAQKRLLKAFRKVRQELTERLLTIPEGTFSEQQLQVTLIQVQAAILAINQALKTGMIDEAAILADRGVQDLEGEINRFAKEFEGTIQPLNLNRIVIAQDTNNFLINKYGVSIDAYSEALRGQITSQIVQSLAIRDTNQRTVSQLTGNIGRFFQGEEWKINRIVRTELHNIYNFSKLNSMQSAKEQIPDLKKSLMHPIDKRTGDDSKALAKENPIVDIDQPFIQKFKGKTFTFMFPPNRPNDRAVLVPFRKAWDKRETLFRAS